jgi:hypothetical protein
MLTRDLHATLTHITTAMSSYECTVLFGQRLLLEEIFEAVIGNKIN